MKHGIVIVLFLSQFIVGCVINYDDSRYNPFVQYYHGESRDEVLSNPAYVILDQPMLLLQGQEISDDAEWYNSHGYSCIGYSAFETTSADLKYAKGFGTKLGAKIALCYRNYTRTTPGMISLNTGLGITLFQDASQDKYDMVVTYWVQRKPYILGAIFRDLTNEQKVAIGRNRGVYVKNIVIESPAYYADILPGDYLISIDGTMIKDVVDIKRMLSEEVGNQVSVEIFRNGSLITKNVELDTHGIE